MSTVIDNRDHHRLLTKGECLERYSNRNPKRFFQIDGHYTPGVIDSVIRPDANGYSITMGQTTELMHGATVRILIEPGTSPKVVNDLLKQVRAWIKRDPSFFSNRLQAPDIDGELPF